MGTGHVMRCLTLAQVLKENGANVEFICRNHKGNLTDKIRLNGFVVHGILLKTLKKVKLLLQSMSKALDQAMVWRQNIWKKF